MANAFSCPASCDEQVLAVTDFNPCITSADIHKSEIDTIFIAKYDAKDIENPEVATEWIARVSQTATDADAIRPLTVIADKPAATSTPIEVSKGRTINGPKTNVINFTVDEVTAANYDFFRGMECGGKYKIWYQTRGGFLYGGSKGIILKGNTVDPINDRGNDAYETIQGTLTWESPTSFTERVKSPIADNDFNDNTPPEVGG